MKNTLLHALVAALLLVLGALCATAFIFLLVPTAPLEDEWNQCVQEGMRPHSSSHYDAKGKARIDFTCEPRPRYEP